MTLPIPMPVLIVAAWLLVLNVIAYAVMAADKKKAQKNRRRTPERTLFAWAAVGGALGVWIAMGNKRHKTKHASFVLGIPALLLLNIAVYGGLGYLLLR